MEQIFNHIDMILIFSIYAMSLNLLLGYAGQLSIAHAAFGAIGAYTAAYLLVSHAWSFFPAFAMGLAAALVVGVLTSLPALYLDVRYLILLTLALSTAALAAVGAIPALGGAFGLHGVPNLEIFGATFSTPTEFFVPLVILAAVVLVVCALMAHSPFGRVLRAIRDDELATSGIGKNIVPYKVSVFGITAAMAGAAGIMLVIYNRAAQPGMFDLAVTLQIVAIVVIGGTGNLLGSILGAAILVLLEPVLRDLMFMSPTNAALAQISLFGLLIVVFLLLRPQGLIPESWTPAEALRRFRDRRSPRGQVESIAPSGPVVEPGASKAPHAGSEGSTGGNGRSSKVRVAAESIEPRMELEVEGLKKSFKGIRAADGLDLRLESGRVTGLIGPNGAGKTTVFNLLTGVVVPDSGTVWLRGSDVTAWTVHRTAQAGMVRSYQDVRIFPRLTVLENVMIAVPGQPGEFLFNALLRRGLVRRAEERVRAKAMEQLEFVGLADKAGAPAGSLAFGEQKIVALARLLATEADVLLLDEPASGVDMDQVEVMLDLIMKLRNEGKSICVVEHNLHAVERVADSVYFMEAGRIIAQGTVEDLMSQERLVEVYFGSA